MRTLGNHRTSNFENGNRRLAFVGYLQENGYNRCGGNSLRIGDDDNITMVMVTVIMITVMMMMLVFRKKRDAIDMLAGPVIRNHDDYNGVDDHIQ